MSLFSKLFGVLLLVTFSTVSQAQNYYVCDSGDDANDGKSEAKPFKTHTKAISTFNKMFAGGSVLYCRGGKFYSDTFSRIANSKCGTSKVCTFADYGSQELPNPIIYGVGETPFNFQNGGDSKPDGGYIIKNLDLIALEKTGTGIMLYNDVDDIVMDNLHIEGFNVGVYSAGANKPSSGNQANDRVVLKNSTIINNKKQGWLGGCNDCLIENNHFENNGNLAVFDHNIYLDSPIKKQTFYNQGITVRGNTLTKSNMVDGKCSGVSLVAHGILKDLVIENNLIKEEAGKVTEHCWGIGIDPGNSLDESFIGVRITNNKLINVGNTGIGCASCVNVLISNNTIIDEGDVLRSGIAVPNKKSEDSIKSDNVVIENNKIILNHDLGFGISLGGSNPYIVRNNDVSTNQKKSRSSCFNLTDANANTDVSINSCGTHTQVSIIDQTEMNPPAEDEQAPSDIVEEEQGGVLPDENTDVVVTEPDNEPVGNEPSTDSPQVDDSDTQVVDVPDYTEQPLIEEELSNNFDESDSEDIVNNTNTPSSNSDEVVTRSPNQTGNQNLRDRTLSETEPDLTNSMGPKPRKASGGGSSSGGSSSSTSSKTSNTTTLEDQESISEGVAYFEPVQPSQASAETSDSDLLMMESKTIQNSSPSITKLKDVINAKQEDLSTLDPSQCRASANGKCIMR